MNELIVEPLMIPLLMVVRDKLRDGPPEMALADRNHPIKTLFFNGAHEAFRVRVGIRRPERRLDDVDPGVDE